MMERKINKTKKHLYEKPRLRTIELVADEVLAVGCKVRGGGQNGFNNPGATCMRPRQCYGEGS